MSILKSNKGVATLIALVMVAMLTLIGVAAMFTADDEVAIAGNEMQEMQAFYAAEAGLDKAAAYIQNSFDSTGKAPSTLPSGSEKLNDCTIVFDTKTDGVSRQKMLTSGTLAGLHALTRTYTLTSTATSGVDNASTQLSVDFETQLIPVFQFAVFYLGDLEIAPGPKMQLNGRVHTNSNLYLQAGDQLTINSFVTSAGKIMHGRKGAGTVDNGDVLIKNKTGLYKSMKDGAGWLESTDSHWYDSSTARWQGNVQDAAHGQGKLNLPLNNGADPHKLVEPATGNPDSYENKADVKFINGSAFRKVGGVWVDATALMVADGVIKVSSDKFTDQRENKKVDVMDLDIGKMYDKGYAPVNGVIYFSDNASGTNWPALRLKNGSELDAGLTIASKNPVYTVGNFNSVNKKPASIMADALTIMSSSWDDAKSTQSYTNRKAAATKVNASFIIGNTKTTGTNYNGGFENLPRFLEDWGGVDLTWFGSMVNMWLSQQSTGNWGDTYYSPPNRIWAYDMDLNDPDNMPPATPNVRIFQRTGWKQHDVGI